MISPQLRQVLERREADAKARPNDAEAWRNLGLGYREAQQMDQALEAFQNALALSPQDLRLAMGVAQLRFETGWPAAEQFRQLAKAMPGDLTLTRSLAGALAAEGQAREAEDLLAKTLSAQPTWLEGHKLLSVLRTTALNDPDFARNYQRAASADPSNLALRLAWYQALATAKDWAGALQIVSDAQAQLGDHMALKAAQIVALSELGEGAGDDQLFRPVDSYEDPGLDLCHVRHCLRAGMPDTAAEICRRRLGTPVANVFWPYLGLAWRLLGDDAAQWLDGPTPYVQVMDLDYAPAELEALAKALLAMHTLSAPYTEQSVRGGTQTDRQLFFRNDPEVQKARAKITQAVASYLANLPAQDPRHPMLAFPRDDIRFEGSWSVRLGAQGFHSRHTHPMGWISSAFYVALPKGEALGPRPSGWFTYGAPPPELGLSLKAYGQVEPKPGRLVLFPSTLWHGTEPFQDGERLTMAFDVKIPRLAG